MAITALPTPPSRQDPTTFNDRADAFLGALPQFQTEANALQTDVNAKQVSAATSATNAAASATAAANTANATLWVSGTSYSAGTNRYSPIDFLTYRRKSTGSGTLDPSQDPTNWALLTGLGDVSTTGNQTIGGTKTFSQTVLLSSGGFSFSSEAATDTGLYWIADGRMGAKVNGTSVGEFNSNGWSGRAGKASSVASGGGDGTAITFNWSGQGGQPTWLFGGETPGSVNVYNPGNFNVNYANSAGTATNVTNALGAGQTWTSQSRAANTWYQNTTGKPIMVNLVFGSYGGGALYVGPSTGAYATAAYTMNDINQTNQMSAIIPNNYYYYCTGNATWYELR